MGIAVSARSSFILNKRAITLSDSGPAAAPSIATMTETITPLTAFDDASLDQAFRALTDQVRSAASQLTTAEAQENFRLDWLGRKARPLEAAQRDVAEDCATRSEEVAGHALQHAEKRD